MAGVIKKKNKDRRRSFFFFNKKLSFHLIFNFDTFIFYFSQTIKLNPFFKYHEQTHCRELF
jgi:hypothetical protein